MSEITFIITLDTGEWAWRGLFLYRSILHEYENPDIIVFTPAEKTLPGEIIDELAEEAEIISEPIKIPSFHASAKLQAFNAASSLSDKEYLLLLDTDTLLLNPITVHRDSEADLFLKPVDLGGQYWGTKESEEEWKWLAEETGHQVPTGTVESTVDHKNIRAYFNTGVVLSKNNSLPEQWISLVDEIHNNLKEGFMIGQVAMALLSEKYDVTPLSEQYNYPLPHRFGCPKQTHILHYHTYHSFFRVHNRDVIKKIRRTGIIEHWKQNSKRTTRIAEAASDAIRTAKGRIFGYG